jgi:hypothetical protein
MPPFEQAQFLATSPSHSYLLDIIRNKILEMRILTTDFSPLSRTPGHRGNDPATKRIC